MNIFSKQKRLQTNHGNLSIRLRNCLQDDVLERKKHFVKKVNAVDIKNKIESF